ncbi:MAG: radical SAM family heme chaperone HemW [Mangrovicoccus sp.]|nr:radical SAM family heme chaperone HemW [Mangrovicoccus sp.]
MTAEPLTSPATWQRAGFGIYVHWPFCAAKCPYCDFNSHVAASIDHPRWASAYERAIDLGAAQTPGRVVKSVFFGGGTPSLMDPATTGRILDRIAQHWTLANDVEITLEANPSSVEGAKFAAFRDAGVNRVSLGVQALNDHDLRQLGRLHDLAEALEALDIAQVCFDRVSFDLIYARQDQSEADWQAELTRALALGMDHLSLYQLTIEPGTPFHARQSRGGLKGLPDEDRAVHLYEMTQEICEAAGLPAYEVSNHARPGSESRHNQIYWRGGDWLGIGPGAHGRIDTVFGRRATAAESAPQRWLAEIEAGGDGICDQLAITPYEQGEEYLMMGLRLSEGIDLDHARWLGVTLDPVKMTQLMDQDLILRQGQQIMTTARGRLLLNAVLAELLGD